MAYRFRKERIQRLDQYRKAAAAIATEETLHGQSDKSGLSTSLAALALSVHSELKQLEEVNECERVQRAKEARVAKAKQQQQRAELRLTESELALLRGIASEGGLDANAVQSVYILMTEALFSLSNWSVQ